MKLKIGKRTILLSVLLISCVLWANAQRRPVIGISDAYRDETNAAVPRSYVNAVLMTGGIPVVIPLMQDDNEIAELLNSLDGIIFTGGEDFDPAYYKENPIPQMGKVNAPRDRFDLRLLRLAAERGVPILGICRGVQLINIGFGGTLYQDLSAQYSDKSIRHRQSQSSVEASHSVIVEDNTHFSDIVKERMLMVNSSHHQAIKDVAQGFRIAGKSPDKIVEVIEKIDDENWILGVQFHPEMRVTRDNAMRLIFQRFIDEARNQYNPFRPDRTLIASRTQTPRASSQESPINNKPLPTPAPEIIYKNVIDTQYIYKVVLDTLYVTIPPDTAFRTRYDTVYIASNTKNISPEAVSAPKKTAKISPETASTPTNTVKIIPETADNSSDPRNVKVNPVVTAVDTKINPVPDTKISSESDTMIFTPGETIETTTSKKTAVAKANNKREEKEKEKQAKKEADEKNSQIQKESQAIAKLKENEKTKQEEKEKYEKKIAKANEKQYLKQQKENAKLDKKELKIRKKQGTAEKE